MTVHTITVLVADAAVGYDTVDITEEEVIAAVVKVVARPRPAVASPCRVDKPRIYANTRRREKNEIAVVLACRQPSVYTIQGEFLPITLAYQLLYLSQRGHPPV